MANSTPQIHLSDGLTYTTTREVAEYFQKHHKDVIRKLENLDCSPEFNQRNFTPVKYIDGKGEARTEYQVTRDGFAFLAMGFTGKKAAQFKEAYITAFNKMESQLKKQDQALDRLPMLSDRNRKDIKRAFGRYVDNLGKSKTQLEVDALAAYFASTASGYSLRKGVESMIGVNLDNVISCLIDEESILIDNVVQPYVMKVGKEAFNFIGSHIDTANTKQGSLQRRLI